MGKPLADSVAMTRFDPEHPARLNHVSDSPAYDPPGMYTHGAWEAVTHAVLSDLATLSYLEYSYPPAYVEMAMSLYCSIC